MFGIVIIAALVLAAPSGRAMADPTTGNSEAASIAAAMQRIQRSVDPCGESRQVVALLREFGRCPNATYKINADTRVTRNLFDRPQGASPRIITWNPELRSELESGCDGDPAKSVQRDPTASLLHEIAHAVQDCRGLNPGEHEAEAVRIENIYRRAVGLCQRSRYGEEILPLRVVKLQSSRGGRCWSPSTIVPDDAVAHDDSRPRPQQRATRSAVVDESSGDRPN
ncbi:MAG: hypothetical protein HY270_21255 [Deltaproteobacteria bacterium]|nr:hypothetical protein [Deltaproteobacteria bacterium]